MNTALRLLRNELAWLADATRLATNTRTLNLEKTTGEIVFMQLDEIDRERAEIREAIDILESQRRGRRSRQESPWSFSRHPFIVEPSTGLQHAYFRQPEQSRSQTMDDKRQPPPERGEGADALIQWTALELCKIRIDATEHLAWAEEQLEIARMLHHEAVKAEQALRRLIDGEMYRAGRVLGQEFDCDRLDAEICPDALIEPRAFRTPPAVAAPTPILRWLAASWALLDHYWTRPILAHLGVAWKTVDLEGFASTLHSPSRATVKGSVDPEERQDAIDAKMLLVALPPLFQAHPELTYRLIQAAVGLTYARTYAAVSFLERKHVVRVERPSDGRSVNLIFPVDAQPSSAPPALAVPAPPAAILPPCGAIPPRKVDRAREMIKGGLTLTAVAGMLDVSKRDLHAALHPNGH